MIAATRVCPQGYWAMTPLLIRCVGLVLAMSAFAAQTAAAPVSSSFSITTPAAGGLGFVALPVGTTAGLFGTETLTHAAQTNTSTKSLSARDCGATWRQSGRSAPFNTASRSVLEILAPQPGSPWRSVDCSNFSTFFVGDEQVTLQTEDQLRDLVAGTLWVNSDWPFYFYVTLAKQRASPSYSPYQLGAFMLRIDNQYVNAPPAAGWTAFQIVSVRR
jgi:hypothetical protein